MGVGLVVGLHVGVSGRLMSLLSYSVGAQAHNAFAVVVAGEGRVSFLMVSEGCQEGCRCEVW
jgi:hypothetical protein